MEESLRVRAKQLRDQPVREQNRTFSCNNSRRFFCCSGADVLNQTFLRPIKQAHDRGLHPRVTVNCAGYKVLTSMEEYLELINASLPGRKRGQIPHPRFVAF